MADLPVTGGSGLFAPADGKDPARAGARDGMEQYVGVGQAKTWLQQNEEALPSQRASLKPLDSSRLQRSSRSPKRPGHSLVVPVATTDLPETEGVVKPHRSTAVRLLEGLEGIETSDSLIDLPAEAREPSWAAPSLPRDGPGRLGIGSCYGSRSVPELEKMEPVRVLQASPVLSRRTLHPTMWASPRETRVAPPRLYWPTMTGRSNDNTVDITSKQPVRLLSPAVSLRNIEPVSVADKSLSPAAPFTTSVASVPVSPPFSCRRAAESWNPPPRLIEHDFSWQPDHVETNESSLEKVTRAVPEAGSPVVPRSAMSLAAPVFQSSRATLGSTSDWKISFNPVVKRSILTPGAQVAVSPPVRSFFPSYPMAAKYPDSLAKLLGIMEMCDELGVDCFPSAVSEDVFVVPLLSWYSADFDDKDPFPDPNANFDHQCRWPLDPETQVWKYMLKLNEAHLQHPYHGTVITFSHFLPSRNLPFSAFGRAAKAMGCEELNDQVKSLRLRNRVHVYGHSSRHFSQYEDGILYVNHYHGTEGGHFERAPLFLVHDGKDIAKRQVEIYSGPTRVSS